jgi:hypothetical protein
MIKGMSGRAGGQVTTVQLFCTIMIFSSLLFTELCFQKQWLLRLMRFYIEQSLKDGNKPPLHSCPVPKNSAGFFPT